VGVEHHLLRLAHMPARTAWGCGRAGHGRPLRRPSRHSGEPPRGSGRTVGFSDAKLRRSGQSAPASDGDVGDASRSHDRRCAQLLGPGQREKANDFCGLSRSSTTVLSRRRSGRLG
jgi:hypothetical protein